MKQTRAGFGRSPEHSLRNLAVRLVGLVETSGEATRIRRVRVRVRVRVRFLSCLSPWLLILAALGFVIAASPLS